MEKAIQNIVKLFDRIDARIVILLVLSLNFLSFALTDNEEHFLQYAKQYMDPDWIPGSFVLTEWAGYRWWFQGMFGFVLKYFSFEAVAFGGKLINFALLAIPLAALFKHLKLSNVQAFAVLQVFIFSGQAFFGGEWIFGGVEPKTFAYVFLFWSLLEILKGRYFWAFGAAVIATYLHVLVGGWLCVILSMYALYKLPIKKSSLLIIGSFIAVLPLIIYLGQELIWNNYTPIDGINLDWVYVYYRIPHHAGIIKTPYYFFINHLPGVLYSGAWLLVSLIIFKKYKEEVVSKLNTINLITFAIIFLGVLVAIFDRTGMFLKYQPFRISSMLLFLMLLLTMHISITHLFKPEVLSRFNSFLLVILIPVLGYAFLKNIDRNYFIHYKLYPEQTELIEYVKNNSDKTDIITFYKFEELSLIRKLERNRFVVWKYDPVGNGEKKHLWYWRLLAKNYHENDIKPSLGSPYEFELDFILSRKAVELEAVDLVFNDKTYFLYKVRKF